MAVFLDDVRSFLERVEDFGKLSGGQLKDKYGCDPRQGYEWIAKQARELAARIDGAREAKPPPDAGSR
jgi:hypothetical protein